MNELRIGLKFVGFNHPTYIIAEIGSNHNGSIVKAKKLIQKASECCVDAVKFQFFRADTIAADSGDKIAILEGGKTLHQFYKEIETPYEWCRELKEHCEINNVEFLATPFDKDAVDLLEMVDIAAYKVASFEIVDYHLLEYIANKKKPIILSTGMANIDDIDAALKIIRNYHLEYILLHCGIGYPIDYKYVNLKAIKTLKKKFNCPVGYSDHTSGIIVPILGVGLEMDMIEKHFTLDRNLKGPDHSFAIEPDGLKLMVESIRKAEFALGTEKKIKMKVEDIHYKRGRRSLFIIKDLKKGTTLTHDNVLALRPGNGLHPKFLNQVIGKRVKKNIPKYTPLSWDLIEYSI